MRVHRVLLLLGATLAACSRPAPAARSEIEAAEERLRAAMVAADTATLGALWAPDYASTSAVGHSTTRAEGLMAYGAGLVRVDTAALREVTVQQRGDSAVSTGILEWAGSAGGGPFGSTVRFEHRWVRQAGQWRLVSSRLSRLP